LKNVGAVLAGNAPIALTVVPDDRTDLAAFIGITAQILYGRNPVDVVRPDSKRLRLGTWNLQHFKDTFSDDALDVMAALINDHDVVFMVEVSGSAPWAKLLPRLGSGWQLKDDIQMGVKQTKNGEIASGFYGAVLFRDPVDVKAKCAQWDIGRWPFTFILEHNDGWAFTVTEVHLAAGEKKETFDELESLAGVGTKIQTQLGPVHCIYAGDFNCDIRNAKPLKQFKLFVDKKKNEYVALLDENTMVSEKNDRCNDQVLIPPALEPHVAGTFVRTLDKAAFKKISEEYVIVHKQDLNAALQPFFTDHSLVTVTFNAEDIEKTLHSPKISKAKIASFVGDV